MKPFTGSTYGRNHYFKGPKEHTVPKSSKDRRGTRSSARQKANLKIKLQLKAKTSI